MGILQKLRDVRTFLARLASDPGGELGKGAGFVQYQIKLWTYCLRRLRNNNAMAMSAALSFRTIFAMVPSLVLVILMLQTLGVQKQAEEYLHNYINRSGITAIRINVNPDDANQIEEDAEPATVATSQTTTATAPATTASVPNDDQAEDVLSVEGKLNEVIDTVKEKVTLGRLGPIGVALLIWTALTLMTTVERSLNRIFRAPGGRSIGRRTLLYWSALTLGPVALIAALGAAEYVSRYANEFLGGHYWLKWLLIPLGLLQPIIVGILLFAGAYALSLAVLAIGAFGFRAGAGSALRHIRRGPRPALGWSGGWCAGDQSASPRRDLPVPRPAARMTGAGAAARALWRCSGCAGIRLLNSALLADERTIAAIETNDRIVVRWRAHQWSWRKSSAALLEPP